MTAHRWTYLVADLASGTIINELPMSGPSITKKLNDAGTLSGTTLPITDPRMRALNVYDMTTPCRRCIYALRDDEPWWGGIIWTRSYDSESEVVTVNCSDFWSYFDHRKVLPVLTVPPPSSTYVAGQSTVFNNTDQNDIARALVAQAQAHVGGNIGIALDSQPIDISNGSFESTAAPWFGSNGASAVRTSTLAHSGLGSLLITPNGVTSTPTASSEDIPTQPGASISIAGYLATPGGTVTRSLNVVWKDANHQVLSSNTVSISLSSPNTWFFISPTSFTAPANTAYRQLTTSGAGVTSQAWYIDDVSAAQAGSGGESGVGRNLTYWGYEMNDVGTILKNLCNIQGGPDMMFDVSGFDSSGHVIRRLRIGTPTLGQQGSPHAWDAGGNMLSYVWASDGTKMTTREFSLGSGADVSTIVAVSEDTVKYTNGWALLEGESSYTTVIDYTPTLQDHATADQFTNRLPVLLLTMTVKADVQPSVGEWQVGDDALVVIKDAWLPNGINVRMRIVAASITPSDDVELVTLTMAPKTEEVV